MYEENIIVKDKNLTKLNYHVIQLNYLNENKRNGILVCNLNQKNLDLILKYKIKLFHRAFFCMNGYNCKLLEINLNVGEAVNGSKYEINTNDDELQTILENNIDKISHGFLNKEYELPIYVGILNNIAHFIDFKENDNLVIYYDIGKCKNSFIKQIISIFLINNLKNNFLFSAFCLKNKLKELENEVNLYTKFAKTKKETTNFINLIYSEFKKRLSLRHRFNKRLIVYIDDFYILNKTMQNMLIEMMNNHNANINFIICNKKQKINSYKDDFVTSSNNVVILTKIDKYTYKSAVKHMKNNNDFINYF